MPKANKILEKLAEKLNLSPSSRASVSEAMEGKLQNVLDDHLDMIAAAHASNHGSVHQSSPDVPHI